MPKGVYQHQHLKRPFCVSCKKQTRTYDSKFGLCWECWTKKRIEEKNPAWKGSSVKYRGLHEWVVSRLGNPDKCEHCKQIGFQGREIHWANKDHQYKRNLEDWIRLCRKCHGQYDKELGLRKHY